MNGAKTNTTHSAAPIFSSEGEWVEWTERIGRPASTAKPDRIFEGEWIERLEACMQLSPTTTS